MITLYRGIDRDIIVRRMVANGTPMPKTQSDGRHRVRWIPKDGGDARVMAFVSEGDAMIVFHRVLRERRFSLLRREERNDAGGWEIRSRGQLAA